MVPKITRKGFLPIRSIVWVMLFSSTFFLYLVRLNLSIIIIAMVEPQKDDNANVAVPECASNRSNSNNSHIIVPDYGVRYEWDNKLQGLLLGAYFWGFTISGVPGGVLAEKFGPTKVTAISFILSGILTLLGPLASSWDANALIVTRFFIGLLGGVVFPSLHCLVSRWAPPQEKGKFVGALMGGSLGTVATWPLLSAVIENLGWDWAFYFSGILTLLWCAIWMFLVTDAPATHRFISDEERLHIENSLRGLTRTKKLPPYKDMLLSVPFWGLLILNFGNNWGLFFLMTAGPKFMSSVLGFNLGHTGILASLPYLARLLSGFIFGYIGDVIRIKQLMSTTTTRKSFVLTSHILPGVMLIIQTFTGCDVTWSIVLITLSLGLNGSASLTNLQNSQDLSPNYAGTLFGFASCFGSTTGFISPLVVGYLTADHNGMDEWHTIFYIGAAVYIGCGLIFYVIGSGEIQPWNDKDCVRKAGKGIENAGFENVEEKNDDVMRH